MVRKTSLILFLLFLGFSHLLSSAAIPATQRVWSREEYSSVAALQKRSWSDMRTREELFGEEEKRRMDLENTLDYPGTGANKNHDPKTPGTV